MSKASGWLLAFAVAAILLGGAAVYAAFPHSTARPAAAQSTGSPSAEATGEPSAAPSPTGQTVPANMSDLLVGPHPVKVKMTGKYSWALMDLRTGKIYGSDNMHDTQKTASMIKAWIAADYLRRQAENGKTPSSTYLDLAAKAVQRSDNNAASTLFSAVGNSASTKRMISMCNLEDSKADDNWSNTLLSAYDTAKLGACIASGKAAGEKWTPWLLTKMRTTILGTWGIKKAFPDDIAKTIAIKNGWVDRQATQTYTVNCLAIGDKWSMGVMTSYPLSFSTGEAYGAGICKQVAAALKN
ncbi:serine hydrolase [Hamadaea sp. NPDC050747]|uniref:serine hydrolase n=1 Tax=Hamadaea sp. NPDC050747 TaxID=3155789 RepID=UPI0033CD7195